MDLSHRLAQGLRALSWGIKQNAIQVPERQEPIGIDLKKIQTLKRKSILHPMQRRILSSTISQ
jgi:hypothetical protein